MFVITVSGGTGSASFDFGSARADALSLQSPDNTPMYDFHITNANGSYVVGAQGINAQKTKINESFSLDGICTLIISNAVDDGAYSVEIFSR